jgi:rSAM/selenodomain-associated transferase 1
MNDIHRVLSPQEHSGLPKGLCALAVMTKAPRAGKVKTRLSPPLTPEEAAQLNSCFLRDTAASIAATVQDGRARGIAVYTPLGAEREYGEILPAEFALVAQRGEALEDRLIFATEDLFSLGFESACLINSDSPTVPPQAFSQAVQILSEPEDALVLGPSEDGGYYLIGLKKLHRSLFQDIDWSTEHVLEQTIESARKLDLQVHLLPMWFDVDDRASLSRLVRELFTENGNAPEAFPAPSTRGYLTELLLRDGRESIWPNE